MRILHLHDSPEIPGGPSGYLGQLLVHCAQLGHINGLFSLSPVPSKFSPDFSHFFEYSPPDSSFRRRKDFHCHLPPLRTALANAVESFSPDLIHIQNWSVFRSTLFPFLRKAKIPTVMTVHDFSFMDPNPWGVPRDGISGPFRRWLDAKSNNASRRAAFRAVDCFLCPSEALMAGIPFPDAKARLFRLPLEERPLQPFPEPSPLRLLFGGTLYPSKGVDLLIQAIGMAKTPMNLEIAGAGESKDKLIELSKALKLEDSVHFLGQCNHGEMANALARCHAVVLPSRVEENAPFILLEAASTGRPGIGSHLGGIPELLSPPHRGWTFPAESPGDLAAILDQIAETPQELMRRGEAFREWVQTECSSKTHWDNLEHLYSELVS